MSDSTIRKFPFGDKIASLILDKVVVKKKSAPRVSILTAGRDKHYSHDLATALIASGEHFEFVCGDELDCPDLRGHPQVRLLNLRGDQTANVGLSKKIPRVLNYYRRLIFHAATSRAKVFHILWNNKFELFDRTALMLFYRLCGKKIVFTAHNVNAGARDGTDSDLNRFSLKAQYHLCDHILVHTQKMKSELLLEFGVPEKNATVIPYGINSTVPVSGLTHLEARQKLGLGASDKVILFFGNIAPYKGLEYLVAAFTTISHRHSPYRLVIAGHPKGREDYWTELQDLIAGCGAGEKIIQKIGYVPDVDIEIFFKAADVLVLPYTHIFQSGILFLGYSFGLPVIAADVGSFKEEIIEGETGFIFEPKNANALAHALENYFESGLYLELDSRRAKIQNYANERHSWNKVAAITTEIYSNLSREETPEKT